MANAICTLDLFGKIAVVSEFTHSDDTKDVTLRVGGVTFFFSHGEARDIARRLVAICDAHEAEKIANDHENRT